MIELWTDGACSGNPGVGGWGAVVLTKEGETRLSGANPQTTNNRMELQAAIEGLAWCQDKFPPTTEITLYTDSTYLQKGITEWKKKWQANGFRNAKGKPIKNMDLWQQLIDLDEKLAIQWQWVKAHSGIPHNELADSLATQAIENYEK